MIFYKVIFWQQDTVVEVDVLSNGCIIEIHAYVEMYVRDMALKITEDWWITE